MGLGDFIEDVGDAVSDTKADLAARAAAIAAAAEYRAKALKYKKVVTYLEGKIGTIDTKIEDVKLDLSSQHEYFSSNPNSAMGMLITTFDGKEKGAWKNQYETIISNMEQGSASLKIRKTEAEQLQLYWEKKAEMEEAKIFGGF